MTQKKPTEKHTETNQDSARKADIKTLSPLAAAHYKARMMEYPHWTSEETALYLDISRQRLTEMVSERKLKRLSGLSRSGLFSRDGVLAFLENQG
jgi:hypothetical protein